MSEPAIEYEEYPEVPLVASEKYWWAAVIVVSAMALAGLLVLGVLFGGKEKAHRVDHSGPWWDNGKFQPDAETSVDFSIPTACV